MANLTRSTLLCRCSYLSLVCTWFCTRHPGTIYLSTVRKHRGRRYFSHLVMKWITRNGRQHEEVLNWKRDGTFWIWLGNYSGTCAQHRPGR